jgi:ferredoxin
MAKRKIIEIDRDKCDGCGLCTTACAEGALELDAENKAVLVRELFCDGMGACLDVCPTGALRIVERDGEAYDSGAAFTHVLKTRGEEAAAKVHGHDHGQAHGPEGASDSGPGMREHAGPARRFPSGCPGSAAPKAPANRDRSCECVPVCEIPPAPDPGAGAGDRSVSRLSQWPIQLHLVTPFAPYFQGADLLVAADCTAFALGSFHQDLLAGKKLVIACPKLDETDGYAAKLAEIIRLNGLKSLTVAIMSVPCCGGLYQLVRRAVEASGVDLPVRKVVIHIDGQIL